MVISCDVSAFSALQPSNYFNFKELFSTTKMDGNVVDQAARDDKSSLASSVPTLDASKKVTKINYSLPTDILSEPEDLNTLFSKNIVPKLAELNLGNKPAELEPAEKFVGACLKKIADDDSVAYTENMARTYNTSGSPVLDFFFHVMEQTSREDTINLLEKSWACNPNDTIRLIANLRDIRNGKSIRYQTMICCYWLYENHPLTLYNNLEKISEIGYWKDLLHILMTILFDGHVGEFLKFDDCPDANYLRLRIADRMAQSRERGKIYNKLVCKYFGIESDSVHRKELRELRLKYAKHKFKTDLKYKVFHLKIAQLFADQLKRDKKHFEENKLHSISLCSKWAPSDAKHFDKFSLIQTTISVKLLDENNKILKDYKSFLENPEFEDLTPYESSFAYLARREFNKEFVNPLRNACKIPELYMHPEKWGQLDYKRVASKCMMKNKELFIKHDKERFENFVNNSRKVSGATLKPVEIIQKILDERDELCKQVYEKQWISIVDSLKGKGSLFESALSICDVSGSMSGIPLNAALGLTLLTSELSKPPWSSVCMTFSSKPQFHKITQDTLCDKLNSMIRMHWEMNTDFDAAFELILNTAIENELKSDDLPKLVFVFTDMQFDQCVQSEKTNFEYIKKRFDERNYSLPVVVFWNLRASGRHSTPIKSNESGCILISGYSPKLLSFIMNCKEISEINPSRMLQEILQTYDGFKVFD